MFGMGTGGSLRLLSPETLVALAPSKPHRSESLASLPDLDSLASLLSTFSHNLSRFRFRSLVSSPGLPLSLSPVLLLPSPFSLLPLFQDQALDLLVSPSSMRYRTSTDDLSTLSSSRGLTYLRSGNSLLWGGFTLRCLQRLSRPHFASLLCRWHDNSCTRGASTPVLSY